MHAIITGKENWKSLKEEEEPMAELGEGLILTFCFFTVLPFCLLTWGLTLNLSLNCFDLFFIVHGLGNHYG